ncbi:uncharacterized protein DUF2508 [Hydrogenoanaerobacterium saccharovorans]|uniref:DUF2508 domain-containing protein n=1 Tax=Hydrogenoanaerobacterium saccharovorans TaxID=474960 RepID=A0A1H8A2T3_9FIRM|nr:DUF2508 family protein [Hydrogenoanaerobacterium saccharovorans]RPF48209.1 uncharacterized protein DUF2508 [Hydrogenoanaerobacterium saccharovorans]SEM64843.1 Protein of unknown function [Hydrogenoanaerobacterium saccharovorans]
MTELLAKLKAFGKEQQDTSHKELQDELIELRRQLDSIDSCYNMIGDSDLIDSLIYQRIGLMARYEFLIKKAKAQNITSDRIRISL